MKLLKCDCDPRCNLYALERNGELYPVDDRPLSYAQREAVESIVTFETVVDSDDKFLEVIEMAREADYIILEDDVIFKRVKKMKKTKK